MIQVQLISAPWCKRCQTIKPDVTTLCAQSEAELTILNYDDLEEGSEKAAVSSLPFIRMCVSDKWKTYTAATFDEWKRDVAAAALVF
jgi:hypothetical protein